MKTASFRTSPKRALSAIVEPSRHPSTPARPQDRVGDIDHAARGRDHDASSLEGTAEGIGLAGPVS